MERIPYSFCESNYASFWLLVWTHRPWIALTNLWIIHGMMGVYNRFEIQRLFSQVLGMSDVAQD